MLKLRDVHAYYGPIHALKGVSLDVDEGQVVTILGANGAGKTTTINVISGVVKAESGRIHFQDAPIQKLKPERIVRKGIIQIPEGRQLFPDLTVKENLRMGAYSRRDRANVSTDLEEVLTHFPRLRERINQLAGTLSGGEQQMLAIARGLMSKPKLLLLDEPSLGLAPVLISQVYEILGALREEGITMVIAEQNANMALKLADYAYVLTLGQITLEGAADELIRNDAVRASYLGGEIKETQI